MWVGESCRLRCTLQVAVVKIHCAFKSPNHVTWFNYDFIAMLVRESFRDLSRAIFLSTSVGLVYRVKDWYQY